MNIADVIIKPIVSEKSYAEGDRDRYTFKVNSYATKTDIKNAVEKLFKVKVIQVYTANIKGTKTRNKRYSRAVIDTTYKKARVRLVKGQKIDIFEAKIGDDKKSREAGSRSAGK